jgi:hypothetical protein
MKKCLLALVLATGISGTGFAQQSKTDKAFEPPTDFSFNRRFYFELGQGNKLRVELSDINDLQRVGNIDSILALVSKDLELFKDSLAIKENTRRVDHFTDAAGNRKVRILQLPPDGSSFLIHGDEPASLKVEQDTLNILGIIKNPPTPSEKISRTKPRYYRFSLYLNDLDNLQTYLDGRLNQKIEVFREHYTDKWDKKKEWGRLTLTQDPTIKADQPKAFATGPGDYIGFNGSVQVQNYKNYFVPSFGLGAEVTLSNRDRQWRHVIGVNWEPQFLFAKDDKEQMQVYRNDFVSLHYGQGPVKDNDPRKETHFTAIVSLGYLVYRKGDFYEKNTFRLGMGRLKLVKTSIEPMIYFHDFFRGVSPGLRVIQHF